MWNGLVTAQFDVLSHTLLAGSDTGKYLLWISWFRFESWISYIRDLMFDVNLIYIGPCIIVIVEE